MLALAAVAAEGDDAAGKKKDRPKREQRERPIQPAMGLGDLMAGVATMPGAEAALAKYTEQAGPSERELMQVRGKMRRELMEARKEKKDAAAMAAIAGGYTEQITELVKKVTAARLALVEELLVIGKADPDAAAKATSDAMTKRFQPHQRGDRPAGKQGGEGRKKGGEGRKKGGDGADAAAQPAVTF